jgi:hypothetical protein
VCLFAAGLVGWVLAAQNSPTPTADHSPTAETGFPPVPAVTGTARVETRLKALLPKTDSLLLRRVARERGEAAVVAADRHGEDGVRTLDVFGAEAEFVLTHRPDAFTPLVDVVRLDPARFRLATGPWRRAVLDWAQDWTRGGVLPEFVRKLRDLPTDRLATAEACPAALPLLCSDGCPRAHAVLARHGERAWRLLRAVDFATHPEDGERVARAVETDGDLILRLSDQYGLPFALLLVPPAKAAAGRLPEVVRYAVQNADDDEATAVAFAAVNYAAMFALLGEGKTAEDLQTAVDRFRQLPPLVRELAADHPHTLRLLTETWRGEAVGVKVLERCGPAAGDLLYAHYASSDKLKRPALVAMARLGEPARQVFDQHRADKSFLAFLRRADPDLLDPQAHPPAIVPAILSIRRRGQEATDAFAKAPNLKLEVLAGVSEPSPAEAVLEWVPGYLAVRTVGQAAAGRHVSDEDVFWAVVDVVDLAATLFPPGKAVTTPVKVGARGTKVVAGKLATTATRKGVSRLEGQALEAAGKGLAETLERQALEALKREGTDLSRRWGREAGEVAARRVEARTGGVPLALTDRGQEYRKLADSRDVNGKSKLVETIGVEGAEVYARHVGYEPLLTGRPGRGQGFDHVCRDGDRIKVIEAKGGDSPTKTYRGHRQGTIENAEAVAEWAVNSQATSAEEKRVAGEVLKAARDGRLDVEVVRTEHVRGKPGVTRVESVVGPKGAVVMIPQVRQTPGGASEWLRRAGRPATPVTASTWLRQGRVVSERIGLAVWTEGLRPLAERVVSRLGSSETIPVPHRPIDDPGAAVTDFVIAVMERVLR